jgi:hypothetical protein
MEHSLQNFVKLSKLHADRNLSSKICQGAAVTSAPTVEVMERCEIPQPGMILWQVELTDGHRVPRHVSSTAPEENKESGYSMLLPWHSGSGKHFLLGGRGKDA